MKTPDEIKKGLERCEAYPKDCIWCEFAQQCDNEADALAYIQQLEAKVPKWISVEERLPEYWVPVLVYRRHRLTPEDGFREICIIRRSEEYGMANRTNHYEVTHWMPLPEPPEV